MKNEYENGLKELIGKIKTFKTLGELEESDCINWLVIGYHFSEVDIMGLLDDLVKYNPKIVREYAYDYIVGTFFNVDEVDIEEYKEDFLNNTKDIRLREYIDSVSEKAINGAIDWKVWR